MHTGASRGAANTTTITSSPTNSIFSRTSPAAEQKLAAEEVLEKMEFVGEDVMVVVLPPPAQTPPLHPPERSSSGVGASLTTLSPLHPPYAPPRTKWQL